MQGKLLYFARAGSTDRVKIGAAKDPQSRIKFLQTAVVEPLQLEGVLIGGTKIEAELHHHLQHRRIRGEWFSLTKEEVASFLEVTSSLEIAGSQGAIAHVREHIERIASELP